MIFYEYVKDRVWPLAFRCILVMKLAVCITFLTIFQVLAHHSSAQKINISAHNQPLAKVMKSVQDQSGYPFFLYGKELAKLSVNANVQNMELQRAMEEILRDQPVGWVLSAGTIILKPLPIEKKVASTTPSLTTTMQKQERIINGKVTDAYGQPIRGVTVSTVQVSKVTSTDEGGNYSIPVSFESEMLLFSMVGFDKQEVPVGNSDIIDVVLKESMDNLDEVLVVGYGTIKKKDLTGSMTNVKTEDIQDIPANSIESLLQGRAAGLQIVKTSQDPGAGTTVRIRGGSSLRGSNSPLIVVDGFPIGDAGNLKQINPADIVSIEVLKDASASSIYGSRGANGVIMVTTKKAKNGQTDISIKHQTTLSQFTSEFIQWTDPALMAQLDNEAKINGNMPPLYVGAVNSTGIYFPAVDEIQSGAWPHFTDWSKVVFRDNPVNNTSTISLATANDKTSFNLSANNLLQQGSYIRDNYGKQIVSSNIRHQFNKYLNISAFNNLSKDNRRTNTGLAYWRNPLWPVYNEDGSYFLEGNADYSHPMAWTDNRKNTAKGTDIISSWLLDLQLISGLSLKSQLNYKYGASIQDRFEPDRYTETGTNNKGAAYLDNWMGQVYTADTYLTYQKLFKQNHDLTAMLGHSYEYSLARSSAMESYNFKNGALNNENMASGSPELNRHRNGQTETKLLSYFGRLNYAFKDKYLLTLTMRSDGSSKFSTNHKWAYFPSGAVSWKLHQEQFIKDLNLFDEFKLRASYGISGNQGISPYQTLSRYGIETFYTDGGWSTAIGPGYVIGYTGVGGRYKEWGGIPNKDLRWETTAQYNFGADFSFFNNRLGVTVDYYSKNTFDLLRERYLTLSSGYDRMWVNDGEINNKGIELTFHGDIIRKRDWELSGTFIFSRNVNKVVSLGNAISSGLNRDFLSDTYYEYYGGGMDPFREPSPNILAVGLPVNVFYGYRVDGIVQSDREGEAAGLVGAEARAGEFLYTDLSQDGVFDTKDRTVIGDPNPDFMASLNLNLRYKNLDMNVFLNGVFGNDVLWSGMYNSALYVPLRWTPDNPSNEYPSVRQGRLHYTSDWFIKDGSFLRIQNVNVGYRIPLENQKWVKQARISINAENPYTFTKFEGYDPEVGLNGRYGGGYPKLRMFSFGVDFTF